MAGQEMLDERGAWFTCPSTLCRPCHTRLLGFSKLQIKSRPGWMDLWEELSRSLAGPRTQLTAHGRGVWKAQVPLAHEGPQSRTLPAPGESR